MEKMKNDLKEKLVKRGWEVDDLGKKGLKVSGFVRNRETSDTRFVEGMVQVFGDMVYLDWMPFEINEMTVDRISLTLKARGIRMIDDKTLLIDEQISKLEREWDKVKTQLRETEEMDAAYDYGYVIQVIHENVLGRMHPDLWTHLLFTGKIMTRYNWWYDFRAIRVKKKTFQKDVEGFYQHGEAYGRLCADREKQSVSNIVMLCEVISPEKYSETMVGDGTKSSN